MQTFLQQLRNMAVPALAEALGVHPATVYAWEAGTKLPDPMHLDAFLQIVKASDDQQLKAWRLLAATARERATARRSQAAAQAAA